MDNDVKALVESAEFRHFHKERQAPRFNVFKVLRYAEYEYAPATCWHGCSRREKLMDSATSSCGDSWRALAPRPAYPQVSLRDGAVKVKEVKREFHYADVAVFLDDDERTLLAIENKVVEMYDDAIGQTRDHVKRLEKECPGRAIHGVLLTASGHEHGAAIVAKRQEEQRDVPMSHVSWHRIHESHHQPDPDDFAADTDLRSFVPQYLEVVERIIHPGERIFEKLLDMHVGTLGRLSEANGEAAIGQVDESCRETLWELVGAFRQRPAEQRSEIEEYLKSKGFTTTRTGRGSARWCTWESREGARVLKSGWSWSIGFSLGGVTLTLSSPPWIKGPAKENVIRFMKENPIERWLPPGEAGRYLMEDPDYAYGYLTAYRNNLLDSRNLADLSFRESTGLLREKLDEFFAPGSDHDRIESSSGVWLSIRTWDTPKTRSANLRNDGDATVIHLHQPSARLQGPVQPPRLDPLVDRPAAHPEAPRRRRLSETSARRPPWWSNACQHCC